MVTATAALRNVEFSKTVVSQAQYRRVATKAETGAQKGGKNSGLRGLVNWLPSYLGLTVVASACGGQVQTDGGTSVKTPASANGGTVSSAAGGTSNGGAAGQGYAPGTMVPLTADQWDQLSNKGCVDPLPEFVTGALRLTFLVDASGSMGQSSDGISDGQTKWEATRNALKSAFYEYGPQVSAGMLIFPNQATNSSNDGTALPLTACVNTNAALMAYPLTTGGQILALSSALGDAIARGATPIADAYGYILNEMAPSPEPIGVGANFIVLVTDAWPTLTLGCQGSGDEASSVDPSGVIDLISNAATNHDIKTIIIGLPDSQRQWPSGGDPRTWLSQLARAGGTPTSTDCDDQGPNYCHYDLAQTSDLQSTLQTVVASLSSTQLHVPCVYPLPSQGQQFDPARTHVVYSSGTTDVSRYLIAPGDSTCPMGEGWYLTVGSDVQQQQLELCANTCTTVQQDPASRISVFPSDCDTIVVN